MKSSYAQMVSSQYVPILVMNHQNNKYNMIIFARFMFARFMFGNNICPYLHDYEIYIRFAQAHGE